MRDVTNIALPQPLIDLIPSRADVNDPFNGIHAVKPFVEAVLRYLQITRQNLSTGDFVELIRMYLNISAYDFYYKVIFHALHCAATPPELDPPQHELSVFRLTHDWLYENKSNIVSDDFYRNLNILQVDFPTKSATNPKKVAVWRNTSKMGNVETRQAVSVRKWIGSTFVGLSAEQLWDYPLNKLRI